MSAAIAMPLKTAISICQQIEPSGINSKKTHNKIDLTVEIEKKQPWKLSEILAPLLSDHQKFVLENSARRRAFGMKSELEVDDASVHCGIISDESDHSHLLYGNILLSLLANAL
jgi:hypothetical protein